MLLIGLVLAVLHTQWGKTQLASLLSDQISDAENKTTVSGIGGFIPFGMNVSQFVMADAKGPWLLVENAKLDLSIADLFRPAVHVNSVGAGRVVLNRLPPSSNNAPPPNDGPFSIPEIPDLPQSIPPITVDRLFIDQLELGPTIIGQELQLSIDGNVKTESEGQSITAVVAIDGPGIDVNASAAVLLTGPNLVLDISMNDTGGLAAALTDVPEISNLDIKWRGEGPLTDWQSDFALKAQGAANANLALDLQLGDQPTLYLSGEIRPDGDLLPPKIADLLARPVTVDLATTQKSAGNFELSKLEIDSEPLQLKGYAVFDQGRSHLEADVSLNAMDLDRFSQLAGSKLGGRASLEIEAVTKDGHPTIALKLQGQELEAKDNSIAAIDGRFDFAFSNPIAKGFEGTSAKGIISVEGIGAAGQQLFPDDVVTLSLDSDIRLEGVSEIKSIKIDAKPFAFEATGNLELETGEGRINIAGGVDEISDLAKSFGQDLANMAGGAGLAAQIDLSENYSVIAAEISVLAERLAGLPGQLEVITGSEPSLSLNANLNSKQASITSLSIETRAARIDANADLGLTDEGTLAGTLSASMPDLSTLEPMANQELSGAAKLNSEISGTLSSPRANLDLDLSNLSAAGQVFEQISIALSGSDLIEKPNGALTVDLKQPQGSVSLATNFALTENVLNLKGLSLNGPGLDVTGGVAANLVSFLVDGELAANVRDLSALQPWHQQDLAGSVELHAKLSAQTGTQDLNAAISIPNLKGSFGELSGLDIQTTVSDALGNLTTETEITLGLFEKPDLVVRDTAISLEGQLSNLDMTLQTAGMQAQKPFRLQAGANADLLNDARTVRLERFQGRAAGQDIRLQRPATITQDNDTLNIDRLDLSVGAAVIEGALDMGKGQIEGRLDLKSLPLDMLNSFGAPDIQGEATGRIAIRGATSAPSLEVRLDAQGLRPKDQAYKPEDGLSLLLTASIARGNAAANIEIGNLAEAPATIQATLPLRLSMEPFVFDLSPNASLDGTIIGVIDLARITRLIQLDGQIIRGLMTTDMTIGGTLSNPLALGTTVLSDGLVEDSSTGLSLKFMRGTLIAEKSELRLEGFEARDGDGGKLRLNGKADIRPGQGVPFVVAITSENMRVLSNELGRVYIETDLSIEGNAKTAAASGSITLTRAEIAIPSGGGIDPVALDISQNPDGNEPQEKSDESPPREAPPAYLVDLDIIVDIPSELFVRGRGLDTEWGGKLEIGGTSANPVVTGGIEFRRGFLDFLDRRFEIPQGEIQFTGANPPIPEINLRAEAQGPSLLAVVSITGPATEPELELTSEPARPNDEILSDLLFNRDVSAITPVQAIRLANAVRTLEGGGIDTMGQVRDAIGVDTLDIGGESPEDASAKVGKYVADGVFLELERGLSSGTSTARVEVELTDNISVNTEVSDDSQAGVGLEWSLDY